MYSATFTFAKRKFDDEFHALDQVIAEAAKSLPAAKQRQSEWLDGYRVTIARVIVSYGDDGIDHPLARGATAQPGDAQAPEFRRAAAAGCKGSTPA